MKDDHRDESGVKSVERAGLDPQDDSERHEQEDGRVEQQSANGAINVPANASKKCVVPESFPGSKYGGSGAS